MLWIALAALAFYLLSAGLACRSRQDKPCLRRVIAEGSLLSIGLILHGIALFTPLTTNTPLHFGAAEALSLSAWLALLLYGAARLLWRLDTPLTALVALAASLLLIAIILPASQPLTYALTPLARGHLLIAMLSYGLFTNAAAMALLMRIADYRLHRPKANTLLRTLPPLLKLEQLLFLCLWSAFLFLTLTILSGIIFAEHAWGHPFAFNHKFMFSLATWFIFGLLLIGRLLKGWRGRFAANWTIAGYTLLLLGYAGERLISNLLHPAL